MYSQGMRSDDPTGGPATGPNPTAATTITVLTSRNRTGKSYSLRNGVLEKTSVATAKGPATGMPVLSAQDLADLLAKVTVDPSAVLVPGHFLGNDDERPVEIVFEKELAQLLGKEQGDRALAGVHEINGRHVAARLKRSIEPCVWQLLDFGTPKGMPAEFAALDIDGRLARLEEIVPGISTCERIECRSSSARIVEPGGVPGRRSHAWIRVSNPELVTTLRLHVQVEAALAGLSFLSPRYSTQTREIVGRSRLTLFDLAVLIPGRIVFCSAPMIEPAMEKAGWSVADAGITIVNPGAGALDISHLTIPARKRREAYREETSEQLEISGHGQSFAVISRGLLTLDTPIETAHAPCVATSSGSAFQVVSQPLSMPCRSMPPPSRWNRRSRPRSYGSSQIAFGLGMACRCLGLNERLQGRPQLRGVSQRQHDGRAVPSVRGFSFSEVRPDFTLTGIRFGS